MLCALVPGCFLPNSLQANSLNDLAQRKTFFKNKVIGIEKTLFFDLVCQFLFGASGNTLLFGWPR
jgi:hypothetical protein